MKLAERAAMDLKAISWMQPSALPQGIQSLGRSESFGSCKVSGSGPSLELEVQGEVLEGLEFTAYRGPKFWIQV